ERRRGRQRETARPASAFLASPRQRRSSFEVARTPEALPRPQLLNQRSGDPRPRPPPLERTSPPRPPPGPRLSSAERPVGRKPLLGLVLLSGAAAAGSAGRRPRDRPRRSWPVHVSGAPPSESPELRRPFLVAKIARSAAAFLVTVIHHW